MEMYSIRNLSFRYPKAAKNALDGITLDINQGEFVTICGRSGCGKSTLLRHLKPVCIPRGERTGEVLFRGTALDESSDAADNVKIGFVTQNAEGRAVTDKVWHELAFGPESMGLSQTEIRVRVAETASFFGIESWFHKNVSELSGGQLQLLNLASVMTMQPNVLLLDEPTSQLDPIAARELLETVSRLNRETGVTVILTEHRTEEAFALSDRIIVMESGRITAAGAPTEICNLLRGSDMLAALPTAMRVYLSVDGLSGKCPVSVRDGRRLMCENERLLKKRRIDLPQSLPRNERKIAIELDNVFFRYEKASDDVLKGLNLKVMQGEFFAICGGNGAGKTTALSVMCGLNKPYSGKVKIFGADMGKREKNGEICIGLLPQNPSDLFVKNTVRLDLEDMLTDRRLSRCDIESEIKKAAELCKISEILDCHPYDISGGEQQRAAIAKVLLTKPKILVLDEPTKGMDAHFKLSFAALLKKLKKSGMTVVAVSHDIEFCAENADHTALFFDGTVAAEDEPRRLFAQKSFYTTAASRMSRGIIENAVTVCDIVSSFGGEYKNIYNLPNDSESIVDFTEENKPKNIKKQKSTHGEIKESAALSDKKEGFRKNRFAKTLKIVFGIICAALLAVSVRLFNNTEDTAVSIAYQVFSIITAAGCALCFISPSARKERNIDIAEKKARITLKAAAFAMIPLIAVPLTVFCGVRFLHDKKYYFISLLIIAELFAPFIAAFEGRKPQARELVIISVLCAVGISGRIAFFSLQQFKPVAAVVIITGVCLGAESGFLVGAICTFVSNFFFGQGPWTPWQMLAFGTIGFFAGILFHSIGVRCTKGTLCIYGALSVLLLYGGIMNPATVILWNDTPTRDMIVSAFIMGLPFDTIHAAATAFFLWLAAEPMIGKLERVKIKYGFM